MVDKLFVLLGARFNRTTVSLALKIDLLVEKTQVNESLLTGVLNVLPAGTKNGESLAVYNTREGLKYSEADDVLKDFVQQVLEEIGEDLT